MFYVKILDEARKSTDNVVIRIDIMKCKFQLYQNNNAKRVFSVILVLHLLKINNKFKTYGCHGPHPPSRGTSSCSYLHCPLKQTLGEKKQINRHVLFSLLIIDTYFLSPHLVPSAQGT